MTEPIDRSTVWPYDESGKPREFYYSRYDHPTGVAAEHALGELEGGEALLYASGMGAVTNVLLTFARAGTRIAIADGAYFGTSKLFGMLAGFGIEYVEYDQTGPAPDADIVWIEAPANPTLTAPELGSCSTATAASSSVTRPSRRRSTSRRWSAAPTSSSIRRRSS